MKIVLLLTTAAALALSAPAFAAAPECAANASLDARVAAIVAKPDRPANQTAMDANRQSEVRFLVAHVKPGDHVLDLGAGGGYSTMILSAAVCDGAVDSQNPEEWDVKFKARPAREALAKARPNIHLLTTDFDKVPVPAQLYDAVFIGTIYHDTYNMPGHDAAAVTKDLYSTLKPGGTVILTDHKSAVGKGAADTNTLHRIEKAAVIADFKAAGFELAEDSDALANPADDHSLKVFDPSLRGHTDRMALVFRKPK